jgi:hypothetical protein
MVVEDLDLAAIYELSELRMFGCIRGYLARLARAEVQNLAARQGDTERFVSLVDHDLHRCLMIGQRAQRLPTIAVAASARNLLPGRRPRDGSVKDDKPSPWLPRG